MSLPRCCNGCCWHQHRCLWWTRMPQLSAGKGNVKVWTCAHAVFFAMCIQQNTLRHTFIMPPKSWWCQKTRQGNLTCIAAINVCKCWGFCHLSEKKHNLNKWSFLCTHHVYTIKPCTYILHCWWLKSHLQRDITATAIRKRLLALGSSKIQMEIRKWLENMYCISKY